MSLLGNQRRKKSRAYKILIVPQGEGGVTRSIKAGGLQLALWGSAASGILLLTFFLALRYTPLAHFVGVKTESKADSTAYETDRRIRALADEVDVLKDYNLQLRKALGERAEKEKSPSRLEVQKEEDSSQSVAQEFSEEDYGSAVPVAPPDSARNEGSRSSFPLFTPVEGVVTQGFEPEQKHFGLDFAAKEGTTVHAAAQGYVVFAGWTYDFGNTLILSHGGGYMTVYKHNSSLLKNTGSLVRRGELIALVGSTGTTSKGPHLHFEVLKDGVPQDPRQYLLNTRTAL